MGDTTGDAATLLPMGTDWGMQLPPHFWAQNGDMAALPTRAACFVCRLLLFYIPALSPHKQMADLCTTLPACVEPSS